MNILFCITIRITSWLLMFMTLKGKQEGLVRALHYTEVTLTKVVLMGKCDPLGVIK